MKRLSLSWQMGLVLLGLGTSLRPAIASVPQVTPSVSANPQISLDIPPPPRANPSSTAGGGKRGGCLSNKSQELFKPILLGNVADTLSAAPGLMWYVPTSEAQKAEFSLMDAQGKLLYFQQFDVQDKSGILKVSLPDDVLKKNASYWWDMTLVCNTVDRSADIYLWGSVNRDVLETLEIGRDLKDKTPIWASLVNALQPNGRLHLDSVDSQQILMLLQNSNNNPDATAIADIEGRLKVRFAKLQTDYAQLAPQIKQLERNPSINGGALERVQSQQEQVLLEMTQIATLFGLWGDAVDFMSQIRQQKPQEWDQLLNALGFSEPEILDAPDFRAMNN